MKFNCYVVENSLSGAHRGIFTYRTDKEAARSLYGITCQLMSDLDISECRLYCIGEYDDETGLLNAFSSKKIVSWNPKGSVEALSSPVTAEQAEADFEEIR